MRQVEDAGQRFVEVALPAGTTGEDGDAVVDQDRLQGRIIETAYDLYSRGSGDNLGPATVRRENGQDIIRYFWTGDDSRTTWTSAWNGLTTAASNATITISDTTSQWITSGNWNFQWYGEGEPAPLTPALAPERLAVINRKAQELLLQHLSHKQRQTWLKDRWFEITTPRGRTYRIEDKRVHNVFLMVGGKKIREYCAYAKDPDGSLPLEDLLFAQLVTLQFNEDEFLRMANTWDLLRNKLFVGQGADADKPGTGIELAA